MAVLGALLDQLRLRRALRGEALFGLREVEPRHGAGRVPRPHERQRALRIRDVRVAERDLPVQIADLPVQRRGRADQRQPRGFEIGGRRVGFPARGIAQRGQPAPQVDFIAERTIDAARAAHLVRVERTRYGAVRAERHVGRQVRIDEPGLQLRAIHADRRDREIVVGAQRVVDQCVELRIAETAPPVARGGRRVGRDRRGPVRGHRDGGQRIMARTRAAGEQCGRARECAEAVKRGGVRHGRFFVSRARAHRSDRAATRCARA